MATATGVADQSLSTTGRTLPPELEQLPCPRCDSTNTKFCYYNNYNLSQPRHFCKSCRRYWTRGGTIRNVPVGGGTRKSSSSSSSSYKRKHSSSSVATAAVHQEDPKYPYAVCETVPGSGSGSDSGQMNLNEDAVQPEALSLSSLMATHAEVGTGGGYMPYGGLGFDLDLGSFGLGLGSDWPMESVCQPHEDNGGDGGGGGSADGGGSLGRDTWQIGGGLGRDADCFGWPDLAISMTGKAKGLK